MIATAATPQTQQIWLALSLAAAASLWLAAKPAAEAVSALPWILCSTDNSQPARPRSVVKTLRSEPLVTAAGKYVTVQLVHLPPMTFSPSHVHGGDVTAYVLKGTVRSEHSGLPAAPYHEGDVFHEPYGTTHVFLENPSATESAEILAITIHDKGAPLTTFLD